MKNKVILLIISLIPLILLSCFEFVGTGSSRRVLQLALAAPGDVAMIHVAVFDGAATEEHLIYKQSVTAWSSIPLDLPAGPNRIVTVWAEGYDGVANHFGYVGPITISEDQTTPLPIVMTHFSVDASNQSFNPVYDSSTNTLKWNAIPGAITYEVYFRPYDPLVSGSYSSVGATYLNSFYYGSGYAQGDGEVRVLTSVFNIPSEFSVSVTQ